MNGWLPSLIFGIGGVVVGAALAHVFTSRRWRIEARKDAYVGFVHAADQYIERRFEYRDLALTGDPEDYSRLAEALDGLRPAFYELRLVAPPRLARMAEEIWVSATELHERASRSHERLEGQPPVTGQEYLQLIRLGFGPAFEDVDCFVSRARRDLTVDWKLIQSWRPLWMWTRRRIRWAKHARRSE